MKGFPVFDITHRSANTQADNLQNGVRVGGTSIPQSDGAQGAVREADKPQQPRNFRMTLETAIAYYAEIASKGGEAATLYGQTSTWLLELVQKRALTQELTSRVRALESVVQKDAAPTMEEAEEADELV